ncbi:MAG: hypothetical protein AAF604_17715 [Acidobacteriota bacterium]
MSRTTALVFTLACLSLAAPVQAGQTHSTEVTFWGTTTYNQLGINLAICKSALQSDCTSWGNSICRPSAPELPPSLLSDFDHDLIYQSCGASTFPEPCVYSLFCSQTCRVTCADDPTPPPTLNQCDYTNSTVCNGDCPGRFNNNGSCFNWTSIATNCWMCRCQAGTPACECTGTCNQGNPGNGTPEQNGDPECPNTPILIDMDGLGYRLTDVSNGALFDIDADGAVELVAWTDPASGDGWLFLDRNQNGRIDHGGELFGDSTALISGELAEHGFAALADLDTPFLGGNGDGIIDPSDERFYELGIWVDANHDGVSDKGETVDLWEAGILWIELDYVQQKSRDEHGNWFQYRGRVWVQQGLGVNPREIYDVILQVMP